MLIFIWKSVVYALSVETGEEVWASETLEGSCSGTPAVSKNGEYVFINHNLLASGSFTVLQTEANGATLYSYEDKIQPLGPLGIYHHPNEGYYLGGQLNDNDILIWAYRPSINSTTVGVGMTFAFQFPIGFTGDSTTLVVKSLGAVTWQTITAPSIFNNGYSMMWGVSRSEFRVWNGNFGLSANRFDKASTGSAEFPRGDPKSQPVYSTLQLSRNPTEPMAFGGTSSNQFVAFNSFLKEMWRINTTFPIFAEARISPDDSVVYFVEQNGRAYAVDISNGKIMWSSLLGGTPITANFAQSQSGKYLYINNQAGVLQAWKVADTASPVPSYSPSGPLAESSNPSQVPTTQTISPLAKLTPTVIPFVTTKTLAPSLSPTKSSSTKGNPIKPSPSPTNDPMVNPKQPVSAITGPASNAVSYQIRTLRITFATFILIFL
jgi:outer membrane protein assembly factor BamB